MKSVVGWNAGKTIRASTLKDIKCHRRWGHSM